MPYASFSGPTAVSSEHQAPDEAPAEDAGPDEPEQPPARRLDGEQFQRLMHGLGLGGQPAQFDADD